MGIEEQAKRLDVKNAIITSIIASLGFITALFWRDAISDTIKTLIPEGEGLVYKYIVAIGTTILVVVAVYVLVRMQEIEIRKMLEEKVIVKRTKRK